MKAIIISDKPKWCALMMNGDKSIEFRKNKALANAIQKLIDEQGVADVYVYCSKGKDTHDLASSNCNGKKIIAFGHKSNRKYDKLKQFNYTVLNGKVLFKFRCYKVEEVESRKYSVYQFPYTETLDDYELLFKSCLTTKELDNYLAYDKNGYAIHISDLEIFDNPKELSEFYKVGHYEDLDDCFTDEKQINGKWCIPIKKAPQNMVYIEIEDSTHI